MFVEAIEVAPELKLKTLDILHLVYARRARAKFFLTLDKDIIRKQRAINEIMNLEVIPRET